MLTLSHLSKTYGSITALRPTQLQIPARQMIGVIGRSGAGKSTLLGLLNRLTDPSGGRITFDSTDVTVLRGTYVEVCGLRSFIARRWSAGLASVRDCQREH
jgi:phosphonate transport system ATP-binding protein